MDRGLCPRCLVAKASTRKTKLCAKCHKQWLIENAQKASPIPPELIAKVAAAKTTEDWQKVAADLGPVFAGILAGTIQATAAQASLIKDVLNRAHGKPQSTQADRAQAAGVIILPTLGSGSKMLICPKCGTNVQNTVAAEPGSPDLIPVVNS